MNSLTEAKHKEREIEGKKAVESPPRVHRQCSRHRNVSFSLHRLFVCVCVRGVCCRHSIRSHSMATEYGQVDVNGPSHKCAAQPLLRPGGWME